jgi:hypothetical protein
MVNHTSMWAERSGVTASNAQVWDMVQGTPTSSPISAIKTLDQPLLDNGNLQPVAYGDFFGDGYASPLIVDSAQGTLEVWKEPLNPTLSSAPSDFVNTCANRHLEPEFLRPGVLLSTYKSFHAMPSSREDRAALAQLCGAPGFRLFEIAHCFLRAFEGIAADVHPPSIGSINIGDGQHDQRY